MGRIISRSVLVAAAVVIAATATLLPGHGADGAITSCDQVNSALTPCYGYLLLGSSVPEGCCSGVRSLNAAARTTQDRRTACSCIKSLAAGYPGTVIGRANGLPGRCGVSVPYKISPSLNCNTIP